MRSAVQRHQSPERPILRQISSLVYLKIQRRQVVMNVLHPKRVYKSQHRTKFKITERNSITWARCGWHGESGHSWRVPANQIKMQCVTIGVDKPVRRQRSREIRPDSSPTRAPNAGWVGQKRRLSTTRTNNRLYLENGTR